MILQEEYELEYDLFLAEQDLYNSMIVSGCGIQNESVGLVSITEGVKETILLYIGKVTASLQKAWNSFKSIFEKEGDKNYLSGLQKKIEEGPEPKFTITNFPTYDIEKLKGIKVIPFDYDTMKEDLDNKSEFLQKNYGQIYRDTEKSFSQNIEDYVTTYEDSHEVTKDDLISMLRFSRDYKKETETLQDNLNVINTANNSIENIAKSLPTETATSEAVILFESYLTEEENRKMEFKDDPDREKVGSSGSFVKRVSTYVSVSTDIVSAKMKIIRRKYALSMRTLKHYMKPPKEDQNREQEQTVQVKTQVEV